MSQASNGALRYVLVRVRAALWMAVPAVPLPAGYAAADIGGTFFLGFFAELFSFLKFCMLGGFILTGVLLVLLALPRSPFRDGVLQVLLWGIALAAGWVVVSPVDFIPFFPLDDMLAGGTGTIAAALAVVQKIRQRREDRELALWTRIHTGAPYPVPAKALLMASSKEGTPDV